MGIPNCLTIANVSFKNRLQYAGVSLTQLINKNALSLATNFPIFPLKLFSIVSTVNVPGLDLHIAKSIDEHKCYCSQADMTIIYNLHLMQIND